LTYAPQANMTLDVTDWLSVTEASKVSGYHPNHLRHLIHEGELIAVRKGLMWLIEPESLNNYVARMKRLGTSKHDPTHMRRK